MRLEDRYSNELRMPRMGGSYPLSGSDFRRQTCHNDVEHMGDFKSVILCY